LIAGVLVSMKGFFGGTDPEVLCSNVPVRPTGDIGPDSTELGGGVLVLKVGGFESAMLGYRFAVTMVRGGRGIRWFAYQM
jgi:hypothetical protein